MGKKDINDTLKGSIYKANQGSSVARIRIYKYSHLTGTNSELNDKIKLITRKRKRLELFMLISF